jgi:hypothetical protein
MVKLPLARMNADRRQRPRREAAPEGVLATQHAFDRHERPVLQGLNRRREIRRGDDVRLRVIHVE